MPNFTVYYTVTFDYMVDDVADENEARDEAYELFCDQYPEITNSGRMDTLEVEVEECDD